MEVSQTNNPFTGEGWEGWQDYIGLEPGSALRRGNWAIQRNGWLTCRDQLIGTFPTPESARAVAEIIEAAVAGQAIPSRKDVAELVEAFKECIERVDSDNPPDIRDLVRYDALLKKYEATK